MPYPVTVTHAWLPYIYMHVYVILHALQVLCLIETGRNGYAVNVRTCCLVARCVVPYGGFDGWAYSALNVCGLPLIDINDRSWPQV